MRLFFCFIVCIMFASVSYAHSNKKYGDEQGVEVEQSTEQQRKLPIDVGGDFELLNHHGNTITNSDYLGKHMLVFFGYTQCKNMCSLTLRRIGGALELLGSDLEQLTPLMITVDPEQDTPEVLATELEKYHSSIIGLTGTKDQLQAAYKAYKQAPNQLQDDWQGDATVSHRSYVFLMDAAGQLQTFFPPILNPQSMANILKKYINPAS